ncbi:MAG TPA: methyltransferase, partial [Desulfobulbaceae bacterium]|nr:methyltransferase [Desulfobulbaceae bacterium]
MACAYWFSEALFTALELQLFALLGREGRSLDSLSEAASTDSDGLFRLLRAL